MDWEWARDYRAEHPETIFLDIRSLAEHREQRIPGSLHLNRFELNCQNANRVLGPPPPRGTDGPLVLVYCRNGMHSGGAAAHLRQCGYAALDLGGIQDWPWALEGNLI